MNTLINLILNLCDCLQIAVAEITNLILQPIFTVIRIFIQCADIFNIHVDIGDEEEQQDNNNNKKPIGFQR